MEKAWSPQDKAMRLWDCSGHMQRSHGYEQDLEVLFCSVYEEPWSLCPEQLFEQGQLPAEQGFTWKIAQTCPW